MSGDTRSQVVYVRATLNTKAERFSANRPVPKGRVARSGTGSKDKITINPKMQDLFQAFFLSSLIFPVQKHK